jgi:hypothetical protein
MLTCVVLRTNRDRCGAGGRLAGARLENVDMCSDRIERGVSQPQRLSGVHCVRAEGTYSSVIECTSFEAGHGLRAQTVAEARMTIPKLQLLEKGADDSLTAQAWDKSLPKKVLELAARMTTVAQAHS